MMLLVMNSESYPAVIRNSLLFKSGHGWTGWSFAWFKKNIVFWNMKRNMHDIHPRSQETYEIDQRFENITIIMRSN